MSDFSTTHGDDFLVISNDTELIFGTAMLGNAFGAIKAAVIKRTGEREMFSTKAGVLKLILIKNPGYEMTLKCAFDKSVVAPGIGESLSLPLVGVTGYVMEGVTIEWESGSERGLSIPVSSWDAFQGATAYRLLPGTGELLEIGGTGLTAPSTAPVLSGTVTSSIHALTWGAVARAASYELESSDDAGATWTPLTTTALQAFSVTGLAPGTELSYRIRAVNDAGDGPWSDALELTTTETAPSTAPVLSVFVSLYNLAQSWTTADVTDDYELQVSTDGGSTYTTLTTTAATTNLHVIAAANTTRKYRVRARNEAGNGPWSNVATQTTYGMPAPSLSVGQSGGGLGLAWSAAPSAGAITTTYIAEVSDDGGSTFDALVTTSSLSFLDTSMDEGDTRHYRVKAHNAVEDSPWSFVQSGTLTAIGVPVVSLQPQSRVNQIRCYWSPVAGATGYLLEFSEAADFSAPSARSTASGTISVSPTEINAIIDEADFGTPVGATTLYVRARAVTAAGNGAWSDSVNVATAFGAPTSLSWTGHVLGWTAPPGSPTIYHVYMLPTGGSSFYMGSAATDSFDADAWFAAYADVSNQVEVVAYDIFTGSEGVPAAQNMPP